MNDLFLKWAGWRPSLGVGTAHALRERGRRWTRDQMTNRLSDLGTGYP